MEYTCQASLPADLDAVTQAYLECAEWAGLLDDQREAFELAVAPAWSEESIKQAIADCRDFVAANKADLEASGLPDSSIGHDFYLTRNRHGAGFWDRGLGDVGQRLTDAAHVYGDATVDFDPETETLILQ